MIFWEFLSKKIKIKMKRRKSWSFLTLLLLSSLYDLWKVLKEGKLACQLRLSLDEMQVPTLWWLPVHGFKSYSCQQFSKQTVLQHCWVPASLPAQQLAEECPLNTADTVNKIFHQLRICRGHLTSIRLRCFYFNFNKRPYFSSLTSKCGDTYIICHSSSLEH